MLRKVIIVGVGGSGGKTLRVMKASLLRQLRKYNWEGNELPRCWQMLWVDTVTVQQSEGFSAPLLSPDEYLGLAPNDLNYNAMLNKLKNAVPATADAGAPSSAGGAVPEHIVGWAPKDVILKPAAGAGAARAIGRVIALSAMQTLRAALDSKVALLNGTQANNDQATVSSWMGANTDNRQALKPICLVVSSVAGGSGAGMFMDVVQALRSVSPDFASPDGIFTILYTPDVFGTAGGVQQVPANALAALTEVLAGAWQPVQSVSSNMNTKFGINQGQDQGFGPKCNFLVGSGNNFIPLGSQSEVYGAVGETLSSLMTSELVQEEMAMSVLQNVFLQNGIQGSDNLKLHELHVNWTQPFSSLGFSRLSVGGDRFADYLSHLIAKDGITRLVWPELVSNTKLKPGQTKQMLVDERVDELWENFYQQTGFNHGDTKGVPSASGEVASALTIPDLAIKSAGYAQALIQNIDQAHGNQPAPASQWVQMFGNYGQQQAMFLRDRSTETNGLAAGWTKNQRGRLADLSALFSIRYGLPVTIKLLERFSKYLTSLKQVMEAESRKMEENFNLVPPTISQRVNAEGNVKLSAANAPIQSAKNVLAKGIEFKILADVYALAANLVDDYRDNYLEKLIEGLENNRDSLNTMCNTRVLDNQEVNPFQIAPEFGQVVPTQFRPAKTELVLITPDEYQNELNKLIKSILPPASHGQWQEIMVEKAALGLSLEDGILSQLDSQKLITVKRDWIPKSSRITDASVISGAVEFECQTSYDQVQASASHWLRDPNMTQIIAQTIEMSIWNFVKSGSPAQNAQREKDFVNAFANAAKIAAPYVQVNEQVRSVIYPDKQSKLRPIISAIPFPLQQDNSNDISSKLKQSLMETGLWMPAVNGKSRSEDWFISSPVSSIDFFAANADAMVPAVFGNLIDSINDSWMSRNSVATNVQSFWTMRRTRPLPECIPVSQDYLQDMVTGWTLFSLFNLVKREEISDRGFKISVWDSNATDWVDFAFPLLSNIPFNPVTKALVKDESLPLVLQSLAIALVKLHADLNQDPGNFSAIRPYHVLREMGEQFRITDSSQRYFNHWMRTGAKISANAPEANANFVGSSSDTLEDRVSKTKATVQAALNSFNKYCEGESQKQWHDIGLRFEIRDYIRSAYRQLLDVVDDNSVVEDVSLAGLPVDGREDDGEFKI